MRLANQPADPAGTETNEDVSNKLRNASPAEIAAFLALIATKAPSCLERAKAIFAKVQAGQTLSDDDRAFLDAMEHGTVTSCETVQPTTSGFSLADVPWWGWLGLVFVANEAGLFGKNDLQVLDL